MPTFTTQYAPPAAYVKFLRENLSPDLTSDYRIPVIIGTGITYKTTSKSLIHAATKDAIGIDSVTSIVKIGNSENRSDYILGVDYSLGTGADAGKIVWATAGTTVVGSFVVNNLENATLASAITATKTGNLVEDSYVVEVTVLGVGSTKAKYRGDSPMASGITVTETIVVTVDGVAHNVALTSGMTKVQAVAAIQAGVGSAAAVTENVSNQLSITSATQGTSSTIAVTISNVTLKQQLGLHDGVTDDFVYTAGTAGTGRFTVTPRSSRVTTTYPAGEVAVTDIPGMSLIITSTATRTLNEKVEIVTHADQTVKNPLIGATIYIQVQSSKADADYDLQYYTLEEEEDLYATFGEPDPANSLSLGAYVAFRNQVDIIGVVQLQGGSDLANFQAAIDKLRDRPVYYIAPISTNPLVHAYVKTHVDNQSEVLNRRERIGVVGGAANYSIFDHQDSAKALNDERMVFVAPASWQLKFLKSDNKEYTANVDGSYAAVAVAAAAARRDPAEPLTRKQITALTPLVNYNPTQQNVLAASGLMVLDTKAGVTRVRHQLTTAYNASIESKELSVVQLRDHVSVILRNNLEAEYVGTKILRATPKIIESYTEKILEGLVSQEIINEFSNVSATQNPVDPTQIDVYLECRPVYPLNYVLVTFKFVKQAQAVI